MSQDTIMPAGMGDATVSRFVEEAARADAAAVVTLDRAGHIRGWSPAAERIFGWREAEVIGRPPLFVPEEQQGQLRALYERALEGETPAGVEVRWRRRDGSPIDVSIMAAPARDAAGVIGGVVMLLTDVTARRREEADLRASQARLAGILDLAEDAVISVDGDQRIVLFNHGAEKIFGYRAAEVQGRPLDLLLPPRFVEAHRQHIAAFARAPEAARRMGERREIFGCRKDGVEFPAEASISKLQLDGEPRFTVMLRDISARVAVEQALRQTKEEAEQAREEAERANRAKSEFLSRMSHELRTPLNAVLGFAQLLELDPLTAEERHSVNRILKGGRHLLDLINEVLDIARIETGRLQLSPEPVRVMDVLREALDLIRSLAEERNVRLSPVPAGTCTEHVLADRQRLKQVALNLLANGIKYNHEGGSVTVSCAEAAGGRLRLAVRDTGPGIPPDKIALLFAPFERLGAEASGVEGTGLGLALSKGLIEAMGGTIGVDSVVGEGSAFWVELAVVESPIAQHERVSGGELPETGIEATGHTRTVLYIEDNLSNLELVERIVARWPGVSLQAAMQGRLGVELAREHAPDVILLDVHLPDIPGHEVLRQLRDDPRTRSIPVIVVSADATPGQIERLRAAGADTYLTKPLDVARFVQVVGEALEKDNG